MAPPPESLPFGSWQMMESTFSIFPNKLRWYSSSRKEFNCWGTIPSSRFSQCSCTYPRSETFTLSILMDFLVGVVLGIAWIKSAPAPEREGWTHGSNQSIQRWKKTDFVGIYLTFISPFRIQDQHFSHEQDFSHQQQLDCCT